MSIQSPPSFSVVSPAQLPEHLRQCVQSGGLRHRIGCVAEVLHGFWGQRFVTSMVLVTALGWVSAGWPL